MVRINESVIKKGLAAIVVASLCLGSAVFAADVSVKGINQVTLTPSAEKASASTGFVGVSGELSGGNTAGAVLQVGSAVSLAEMYFTNASLVPLTTLTVGLHRDKYSQAVNAFNGYEDVISARSYKSGVTGVTDLNQMIDLHVSVSNGYGATSGSVTDLEAGTNDTEGNMRTSIGASLNLRENLTVLVRQQQEARTGDAYSNMSAFAGYDLGFARVSGKYDVVEGNTSAAGDKTTAMTATGAYSLTPMIEGFAQYTNSTKAATGTSDVDTTIMTLGAGYSLGESAKAVLTYTSTKVGDATATNAAALYTVVNI